MEEHYKKVWYKRWWGMMLIIIFGLVLSFIAAFGFYIYNLVQKINSGEISYDFKKAEEINIKGRPALGAEAAEVVISGFFDFECPYCQEAYAELNSVLADPEYKEKVKFVFFHFPLVGDHQGALFAARAAECAFSQGKFFEMANYIYANQPGVTEADIKMNAIRIGLDNMEFSRCLELDETYEIIENDMRYGLSLGVEATPTFFVAGRKISGVVKKSDWEQLVEAVLGIK